MMAVTMRDVKADRINLDRCYAESDRQSELSRRTQALLAAAGMDGPEKAWFVLRVLPGRDKAVDNALEEAGIERWMPVKTVQPKRSRGSRKRSVEAVTLPAFPGYLFVKIVPTAHGWAGLKTIDGVRGVLGDGERAWRVADRIIKTFQAFLEEDEDAIATLTNAVRRGDRVRVTDGPFASFPGVVERLGRDGQAGRALVEVLIFGQAVAVDLDLAQIEKSY